MPDSNTTRGPSRKTAGDKDVLSEARKRWDRGYERERENIKLAYEDLQFLAGEQWPEKQRKDREAEGRPVLTVNRLPQFVHQITGDIRQLRPAIKVLPVDDQSDEKVANIRGGLIRYIENRSDAPAIYFRAADSQVAAGIGHWRVMTEYADDSTFNQEIRIAPVDDQVSIIWDPDSSLPTREDANWCFVPVDLTRAAFEERYPNVTATAFDDEDWSGNSDWVTDDHVRIAEYWVKKPAKRLLALYPNGQIHDATDADESVMEFHRSQQARIEERDTYKVVRYLITASDVLEGPIEWPGRYIPIIALVGEEVRIGRRLVRQGIVRRAKEPQQMVNYFHSAHTETVALQPKAPFIVTELNVGKYQDLWERANIRNLPYLVYEPDSRNGGTPPQRVAPPVSSQGIIDGLQLALEDMKSVTGIHDASLGARSNETSGRAILARQREGDVGSFVFIDNFARAIGYTGKIVNDLIRHIYDTERTIRIMGEDGRVDLLEINKAAGIGPGGETNYLNDMTIGAYDIVTQIGPSYTTKREEAKEGMTAFVQAAPQVAPLILDLVAKAQDWPMADDVAKRIRTSLPPAVIAMEDAERQGLDPEQARQAVAEQLQPPPDPNVIEAQARIEMDGQRLQFDQAKATDEAQRETQKLAIDAQFRREELAQKERIAQAELEARIRIEREKIESAERIALSTARIQAESRDRDSELKAAIAKHAVDSRPNHETRTS